MYEEHSSFEIPDNENIKIWRFLDFTKFVSLLDKRALFFSKASLLSDPLEGVYPEANKLMFFAMFQGTPHDTIESLWEHQQQISRQQVAVNCWHINEYESAAMWRLYLKSDEGVAIQSTFSRLKQCFTGYFPRKVHIGKVQYIVHAIDAMPAEKIIKMNVFDPLSYKRISFDYERELRAAILLPMLPDELESAKEYLTDGGMYIPADLEILVETVYVSPTAPLWLTELVQSVMRKYELRKDVITSDLYSGRKLI